MPGRHDRQKTIYAEGCIAQGMTDGQSVRSLMEKFGISQATAYRYLDRAYQEFTLARAPELAKKKARIEFQISAQMRRALHRMTTLSDGTRAAAPNLTEVGKCIDRLMRLQGLDKQTIEIGASGVTATIAEKVLSMTPSERAQRKKELDPESGDE